MRERINRAEDAVAVSPDDLYDLQRAVGEDIDEATDESVGGKTEPTESQKRELLKIHKNLGHTSPRGLGRALKHAGAKRDLIRSAMKELRCPVCELRVRLDTRRLGVPPRSMKFNQRVGCALFEFDEFGYSVIILNMICWGINKPVGFRIKHLHLLLELLRLIGTSIIGCQSFLSRTRALNSSEKIHNVCRRPGMSPSLP